MGSDVNVHLVGMDIAVVKVSNIDFMYEIMWSRYVDDTFTKWYVHYTKDKWVALSLSH